MKPTLFGAAVMFNLSLPVSAYFLGRHDGAPPVPALNPTSLLLCLGPARTVDTCAPLVMELKSMEQCESSLAGAAWAIAAAQKMEINLPSHLNVSCAPTKDIHAAKPDPARNST